MATRTISNAGGNYNSTGTWVEAAVPTSADDVVATATSGQLTVNVSSAARTFNFTNYTNTLTVNAAWTISGASLTSTFVSAMNIVQTANITFNSAHSIRTNGKSIPRVAFGIGAGTKTLLDDMQVTDAFSSTTAVIMLGATLSISAPSTTFQSGQLSGSTITVVLNPTQSMALNTGAVSTNGFTVPVVVNANANITLAAGSVFNFTTNTAQIPSFRYISGTFSTPPSVYLFSPSGTTGLTFSFNTSTLQLGTVYLENRLYNGARFTVNLDSNLNFQNMTLYQFQQNSGTTNPGIIRFAGSNRLVGGSINTTLTNQIAADGINYTLVPRVELSSGPTHSITQLYAAGNGSTGALLRVFPEFSSFTASTNASLAITGTHSIVAASFSDIYASLGSPVSTFRSSLTRTTNITNYTSLASGGGGGSWTFVQ